jgi:hypothetical protein
MPDENTGVNGQRLYFITVVTVDRSEGDNADSPVGWMPVFRSAEAARQYCPIAGDVGSFTVSEPLPDC